MEKRNSELKTKKLVPLRMFCLKPVHIRSQCLISIIDAGIYINIGIEFSKPPIIQTAHIINKSVFSKRSACRKAICPNYIAVQGGVVSHVYPYHRHIEKCFVRRTHPFGKGFSSHSFSYSLIAERKSPIRIRF